MRPTTAMGAFLLAVVVTAAPQPWTIDAELACETAREMVRLQSSEVSPAPKPPMAKCTRCKGTGKVKSGDGLAVFDCPECDGGK